MWERVVGSRKSRKEARLTVLTFSPYSFINQHSYPEAIVADALRRRGHKIIQVRCKGLYADYCISMSAVGLTPRSSASEKAAICAECNVRREAIEQEFGFETIYIDDFASQDVMDTAQDRTAEVTPENWTELQYDGIPIPRYASIEYILNEKINTTQIEPALWSGYITHVKNAFITAEAGAKLLDRVKPQRLLAYNNAYSCNHIMCCLAEKRGAVHYMLHAGQHLKHMRSEMTVTHNMKTYYLQNRSEAWKRFSKVPLNEASVQKVMEHIDELIEARSPWVYSVKSENKSVESLRAFFGIRPEQKVLLATMSSRDEMFALSLADAKPRPLKEPIFPSQVVWIQNLVEWVRERDDVFLIVRVHPREFPNKREQILSYQAMLLRATFVDFPANAKVNWPEDDLSLYDVAKIADVGLNATSSAGLELLLMGIPVTLYDSGTLMAYPPDFSICADSPADYFDKIDLALNMGRSIDHVIKAFRWFAFLFEVVAIDIGAAYSEEHSRNPQVQDLPTENLLSRLKRLFKRSPATPLSTFVDPLFNRKGLRDLCQSRWLAYAIELGADTHIETYCDAFIAKAQNSPEKELAAISAAAEKYLRKLNISTDLLYSKI